MSPETNDAAQRRRDMERSRLAAARRSQDPEFMAMLRERIDEARSRPRDKTTTREEFRRLYLGDESDDPDAGV